MSTNMPTWQECLHISELPDIHECIFNFSHDPTEDNAVCMVRAVIAATSAPTALEQFCDGHCTWLDHHPDCVRVDKELQ